MLLSNKFYLHIVGILCDVLLLNSLITCLLVLRTYSYFFYLLEYFQIDSKRYFTLSIVVLSERGLNDYFQQFIWSILGIRYYFLVIGYVVIIGFILLLIPVIFFPIFCCLRYILPDLFVAAIYTLLLVLTLSPLTC